MINPGNIGAVIRREEGEKGTRGRPNVGPKFKGQRAEDVAPRRGRKNYTIQSPPSDQRTNPEMDMSECTKKDQKK